MVCKLGGNIITAIKSIKRNSINERVMLFWNNLPVDVKNASCLDYFKNGLDVFKSQTKSLGICDSGNFWGLTNKLFRK